MVVAEGAPEYGGHRMARQLAQAGILTTAICDSATFAMMARVNKVAASRLPPPTSHLPPLRLQPCWPSSCLPWGQAGLQSGLVDQEVVVVIEKAVGEGLWGVGVWAGAS